VRTHELAIPRGVDHDEDQPDGPMVPRLQSVTLHGGTAERLLKVTQPSLDLLVQNFVATEEDDVRRATERVPDRELHRWPQRRMRQCRKVLGDAQLPGVSQGGPPLRVRLQGDAKASGVRNGAQGVQVHARITAEDADDRGRRHHGATSDILDAPSERDP
jgi:hypothetical protein